VLRRLPLIAALVLPAPALAAQGRTDALITIAHAHIARVSSNEADTALSHALGAAAYLMDTVHVFVWRAILEHMRGSDSLARANFHSALVLYSALRVNGLDQIATGTSATCFESEVRRFRVYPDRRGRTSARRGCRVPKLAYPPTCCAVAWPGMRSYAPSSTPLGEAEGFGLIVPSHRIPRSTRPLQQMMRPHSSRRATQGPGRAAAR